MTTKREVEKLRAIGYSVARGAEIICAVRSGVRNFLDADECWEACKIHTQSPEGLKATMADKVRWLCLRPSGGMIYFNSNIHGFKASETHESRYAHGDSPEAAVDALFWSVP